MLHLYLELVKVRLSLLVVSTAVVGYVLAGGLDTVRFARWEGVGSGPGVGQMGGLGGQHLLLMALGTALAAFGANALNQRLEVRRDALMERTRSRPLPAGWLSRRHGLLLGLVSAAAGVFTLAAFVNVVASGLALSVVLLYTLVYTPLKVRSTLCTLVGAVCGAIPPLIGWAGATGGVSLGGWLLAAILFVWQIPHFLSLAWLYRRDYERGGFRMLPVIDRSGALTVRLLLLYSLLLLPLGVSMALAGLAGRWFVVGSLALGLGLLATGFGLFRRRSDAGARRVFLASLVYLPLLMGLLVVDRQPIGRMSAPVEPAGPVAFAEAPANAGAVR